MVLTPKWILEFYDFTLADGSVQRFVSSGDPDTFGTSTNIVPFDGNDYIVLNTKRGPKDAVVGLQRKILTLTIPDPEGSLLTLVNNHSGNHNQPVRVRRIFFDDISTPSLARSDTYQIVTISYGLNPRRVTIHLGFPALNRLATPRVRVSRLRCSNPWFGRHAFGNPCRYGSDDMGFQTLQDFTHPTIGSGTQIFRFGWFGRRQQNTNRFALEFPQTLIMELKAPGPFQFFNSSSDAPRIWKRLSDNAAKTVDVECLVGNFSFNNESEYAGVFIGIDESNTRKSYVLWGLRRTPVGREYLLRTTVNSVTDTPEAIESFDFATPIEFYLRLERTGDTFNGYTKRLRSDPWTLRLTVTNSDFDPLVSEAGGFTRVGFFESSDAAQTAPPGWRVGDGPSDDPLGLKLLKGGFDDCNQTQTDCDERENTHEINLFDRIPDSTRLPQ